MLPLTGQRYVSKSTMKPGDILSVDRGIYRHFGVYIGRRKVIHYASLTGDFGDGIRIHETTLNNFLRGGTCEICQFTSAHKKYPLYSSDETVRRAISRLGETDYNLVTNNCEHFAIWCKTGISESEQVNNAISLIVFCLVSLTKKEQEGTLEDKRDKAIVGITDILNTIMDTLMI
jgi:hypothetical protein